jgi:hypothetical protein
MVTRDKECPACKRVIKPFALEGGNSTFMCGNTGCFCEFIFDSDHNPMEVLPHHLNQNRKKGV